KAMNRWPDVLRCLRSPGLTGHLTAEVRANPVGKEHVMSQAFPTYCIRREEGGRWTWRFDRADGETIAASQKDFTSAQECIDAIKEMRGANNLSLSGTLDDVGVGGVADASPLRSEPLPSAAEPEVKEEPLTLSKDQVIPQPEPELVETGAAKSTRNLTSKKSEDVIITHLRRLQRESGT